MNLSVEKVKKVMGGNTADCKCTCTCDCGNKPDLKSSIESGKKAGNRSLGRVGM